MSKQRKIYVSISWVLVILCMLVIFSLSAQNGEESSDLSGSFVDSILAWLNIRVDEGVLRTCAHGLEFMGLSMLFFNAIYATWKKNITIIIAFVCTVCYAVTDEIHQIFVPDRAFQISDIIVDSTGAMIGAVVSYLILKFIKYIQEKRK